MTEAEWLASGDTRELLAYLCDERGVTRSKSGRRKVRLFACACVRGIWELLRQPGSRQALYYAERYADGLATDQDLATAERAARSARVSEPWSSDNAPYWQATEAAGHLVVKRFDGGDHPSVRHASGSAAAAWAMGRAQSESAKTIAEERETRDAVHADWLRDLFGNPFRPLPPRPFPSHVVGLAQSCYAAFAEVSKDFLILADALEELGEEAASSHCRENLHLKGCHILDWILATG